MKVISVTTVVTETIETDEHSRYRRAGPEHWTGLRSDGTWRSLYPSRAREMEAAYQAFKKRWEGMMLDRHLCIAMAKELEYVCWQFPGSSLKANIKDDEMVSGYLSARTVRQIALLVKEIERIQEYDSKTSKAGGKDSV